MDHVHAPRVSVREQGGLLIDRLRRVRSTTFRALVADCPDTLHVVARFLALLELYRDSAVVFEQLDALGELHVRWTGSDEGELTIDDEFDEPPEGESDTDSDIGSGVDGADDADEPGVADGTGTIDLTERGAGPDAAEEDL